jgi:hypothetical protein
MSRTFLMTYIANARGTTVWGHSPYVTDRLGLTELEEFVREAARRIGVRDDQVSIINIFELEGPK